MKNEIDEYWTWDEHEIERVARKRHRTRRKMWMTVSRRCESGGSRIGYETRVLRCGTQIHTLVAGDWMLEEGKEQGKDSGSGIPGNHGEQSDIDAADNVRTVGVRKINAP